MEGLQSALLLFLLPAVCARMVIIKPAVNKCQLPEKEKNCEGKFHRYFYNPDTKVCQHVMYGGCGGNVNKFPGFHSMEKCQIACVNRDDACTSPADPGMCMAYMPRYYHNSTTEACQLFIYGGCGGNNNNFATLKACQTVCLSKKALCSLPPETGMCRMNIKRYFYNSTAATCQSFTYGGCAGNGNRFDTIEKCQKVCP